MAARDIDRSQVQADAGGEPKQIEGQVRITASGYDMTRKSDDDKKSELQHALAQVERLTSRAAHSAAPSSAAGFAAKYGPLIELCTDLIGRFPEEATLYYERGQARCVLGLQRPALDDMSKAVERNPKDPKFLFFRGLWSFELGDPTTAVRDFTAIIELETESDRSGYCENARFLRAAAHLSLGQFDLAERDLDHLESDDEADDEFWVGRRCWTTVEMRELVAQRRRPS